MGIIMRLANAHGKAAHDLKWLGSGTHEGNLDEAPGTQS